MTGHCPTGETATCSVLFWAAAEMMILCSAFLLSQSMWKTQRSTVKGYFLAGGQMVWWPVSISVIILLAPKLQ